MRLSMTNKLLANLNTCRGLAYPDVGYSYFANIAGDGRVHRSIYTIINAQGGVAYSALNARSARQCHENIRAAIYAEAEKDNS